MRVYLAARYSRAAQMREVASELRDLGHIVTSRWILGGHELIKEDPNADQERARFAQEDWEDLMRADCCISFTEEPRTTTTRGGRHVEFGASMAANKRVIVIQHRENVFHHLPRVEFYSSWELCKKQLAEEDCRGLYAEKQAS